MTYLSLLILLILSSFTILSADTITLSDGETMEGQLLKVTDQALIFEVLYDSTRVHTISIDRHQVISVIDESQEILYKDGHQQEDPEDYYQKVYMPIFFKRSDVDTIVFKNGDQIMGDITYIKGRHVSYKRSDRPSHYVFSTTVEKIESINGQDIQSDTKFSDPYYPPPIKKVYYYPHPSIEFGLTLVQHHLNQYHGIYEQLAENLEDFDLEGLRDINNPLIALNLGFDLKFSRYICLSFLGNFMLNFGNNKDYHEDVEHFRLFLTELRYTFPNQSLSPWLGAGYALQSITLINNYSGLDIKYKSQSNTLTFAAGIILKINSQFEGNFSLRYLPFGDKNISWVNQTSIQSESKINLSNIMFSASLNINL